MKRPSVILALILPLLYIAILPQYLEARSEAINGSQLIEYYSPGQVIITIPWGGGKNEIGKDIWVDLNNYDEGRRPTAMIEQKPAVRGVLRIEHIPSGFGIGPSERFYIPDRYKKRILIFGSQGGFIKSISIPGDRMRVTVQDVAVDKENNIYLFGYPTPSLPQVWKLDHAGTKVSKFDVPNDILGPNIWISEDTLFYGNLERSIAVCKIRSGEKIGEGIDGIVTKSYSIESESGDIIRRRGDSRTLANVYLDDVYPRQFLGEDRYGNLYIQRGVYMGKSQPGARYSMCVEKINSLGELVAQIALRQIYDERLLRASNVSRIVNVDNEGRIYQLYADFDIGVQIIRYSPVLGEQKWAVVIGVSQYDDPQIRDLKYAAEDAQSLYELLIDKQYGGGSWKVNLLTDKSKVKPTRNDILRALTSIENVADEDDIILIFFSGHGTEEAGASYFLPMDADMSALRYSGIPLKRFTETLNRTKAKAQVMFFDACLSKEQFSRIFSDADGSVILSACDADEVSYEHPEAQRGVFTHYLVEALKGKADNNMDDLVTVSEVANYVMSNIRAWSSNAGNRQNPFFKSNVSGEIVLTLASVSGETEPYRLNSPTVMEIKAPADPICLGETITASASFTIPEVVDIYTVTWDWGDDEIETQSISMTGDLGIATGIHAYTNSGVYTITLIVTDDDGNSDSSEFQYIVVYDPERGFVTGDGWIMSISGSYMPDPALTGKAKFGFVSKYKKGATLPTGNTEFSFNAGGLNFHSDAYAWLVVNQNDTNVQYRGSGTINGNMAPDGEPYKFMLWAKDRDPDETDTFRIRIWSADDLGNETDVYDNGFGQAISGGNIKIHGGVNAAPAIPTRFALLQSYPNPFNPETWIPYQLSEGADVTIRIHDSTGKLVRKLAFGHKSAGFYIGKSKAAYWDSKNEAGEQVLPGIYFYRIQAGDYTAARKMIVAR